MNEINTMKLKDISFLQWLIFLVMIPSIGISSYICVVFTNTLMNILSDKNALPIGDNIINVLFIILALFSIFLSALFFFLTVIQSDGFYRDIFSYFKSQGESIAVSQKILETLESKIDDYQKAVELINDPSTPPEEIKSIANKELKQTIKFFKANEKIFNIYNSPAGNMLRRSQQMMIPSSLLKIYGLDKDNTDSDEEIEEKSD